jgi:hypothetical protein
MDANTWHTNRAIVGCQGMVMIDYTDWINSLLEALTTLGTSTPRTSTLQRISSSVPSTLTEFFIF